MSIARALKAIRPFLAALVALGLAAGFAAKLAGLDGWSPTVWAAVTLPVLLALADHYRKSDPAQATQLYNQVKQEYPDSPAAQQADQGLELLNSKP